MEKLNNVNTFSFLPINFQRGYTNRELKCCKTIHMERYVMLENY